MLLKIGLLPFGLLYGGIERGRFLIGGVDIVELVHGLVR
ncbi:hypothetical protein ACVWYK_001382 [Bradyrhizobium sp. USDA 4470]